MKLMIVDGPSVLRYHVMLDTVFSWESCVVSFFRDLIEFLEKFNEPLHVIVGWDGDYLKRAEKYPNYKANRDGESFSKRVLYRRAREFLHNELPRLGIASWLVTNYEAKDMAMYATRIAGNEGRLVSNDDDYLLAMTENTIFMPSKFRIITWDKFKKEMQHEDPYEVYRWLKAIKGRTFDNVPGVFEIGLEFREFARLLADGKELPDSVEGKFIKENMDLVKRNYELFTLDVYDEKDIKIIEKTFNEALNNCEVPSQEKWLELDSKLDDSETFPLRISGEVFEDIIMGVLI